MSKKEPKSKKKEKEDPAAKQEEETKTVLAVKQVYEHELLLSKMKALEEQNLELQQNLANEKQSASDKLARLSQEYVKVGNRIIELEEKARSDKSVIEHLNRELKDSKAKSCEENALLQDKLSEERVSFQAKIDSLESKIKEYEEDKKIDYASQVLELTDKYELSKREHALQVAELERRNVCEKDRLKNEMLRKIRETKLSLLAMTEDQLHYTTKR